MAIGLLVAFYARLRAVYESEIMLQWIFMADLSKGERSESRCPIDLPAHQEPIVRVEEYDLYTLKYACACILGIWLSKTPLPITPSL